MSVEDRYCRVCGATGEDVDVWGCPVVEEDFDDWEYDNCISLALWDEELRARTQASRAAP